MPCMYVLYCQTVLSVSDVLYVLTVLCLLCTKCSPAKMPAQLLNGAFIMNLPADTVRRPPCRRQPGPGGGSLSHISPVMRAFRACRRAGRPATTLPVLTRSGMRR